MHERRSPPLCSNAATERLLLGQRVHGGQHAGLAALHPAHRHLLHGGWQCSAVIPTQVALRPQTPQRQRLSVGAHAACWNQWSAISTVSPTPPPALACTGVRVLHCALAVRRGGCVLFHPLPLRRPHHSGVAHGEHCAVLCCAAGMQGLLPAVLWVRTAEACMPASC